MGDAGGIRTTTDKPDPSPADTTQALCIECGYLLRGVAVDGNCPECGLPVSMSPGPIARLGGDLRVPRQLRIAVNLIAVAIVMQVAVLGIGVTSLALGSLYELYWRLEALWPPVWPIAALFLWQASRVMPGLRWLCRLSLAICGWQTFEVLSAWINVDSNLLPALHGQGQIASFLGILTLLAFVGLIVLQAQWDDSRERMRLWRKRDDRVSWLLLGVVVFGGLDYSRETWSVIPHAVWAWHILQSVIDPAATVLILALVVELGRRTMPGCWGWHLGIVIALAVVRIAGLAIVWASFFGVFRSGYVAYISIPMDIALWWAWLATLIIAAALQVVLLVGLWRGPRRVWGRLGAAG